MGLMTVLDSFSSHIPESEDIVKEGEVACLVDEGEGCLPALVHHRRGFLGGATVERKECLVA